MELNTTTTLFLSVYLSTENTLAIFPMARILLRMTSLRAEAVAPALRKCKKSYNPWLIWTQPRPVEVERTMHRIVYVPFVLIPQILVKRPSNSVSLLKTEHVSPLLVYPAVQETNTMQTHCYWSLKFGLQKMVCIYKHITSSE